MKTLIKALKGFAIGTIKIIGKTLFAIIITSPITYLAVKEAYAIRGYFAVGGEWMMMIGMVALILWIMDRKTASHE